MEPEWPLVGREPELERVRRILDGGVGGVVLAGAAGVGKTRLAAECLNLAVERGCVPVRVAATQAASALPFGAFASFVPELVRGVQRTAVLRQVVRAVVDRGGGRPVAVLIDDSHLLDDSSAALAHQLAVLGDTFLVATMRSGEPAPDAVTALWKDGLAERIELAPLTLAQVASLVTAALGGPADGAAVRLLWERTEGNPLFLKELLLGAREAGVLRGEGGVWLLRGELPASDRLIELVELRLKDLAPADREALEVLAVAELLGADVFGQLAAGAALESLERRGLLRIEDDGRRLVVRLAHPLYSDVLRARLSPLRRRAVSRWLADLLETTGARRADDVLRAATWRLEGGGVIQGAVMLDAAKVARNRYDFVLAERLARAAADAGAGFEAAFVAVQAMSFQGRPAETETALAALAAEAADDAERGLVAVTRIDNLLYGLGRLDEALRVGAEAEAQITDPSWRDEIAARRPAALFRTHGPRAAVEAAEAVPAREGGAFVWACLWRSRGLAQMGRVSAALDAAAKGRAAYLAHTGPPLLWPPAMFTFAECEALLAAGRLHEAEAVADRAYHEAVADGARELQALLAWGLTKILVARGRMRTAARLGREAAGLFRELRRLPLLAYAVNSLALALALAGQPDAATAVLDERDGLAVSSPDSFAIGVQARGWAAAARGNLSEARRLLNEAAEVSAGTGDVVGQAAALHDLARLGAAKAVASQLTAAAAVIEGDFASLRAAHAAALAAGAAPRLDHSSIAFEGLGADLLAAEAAADAAAAWRRAGEVRRSAAAERRAQALAARCEGSQTPALGAVTARAALSARELEIARLAAAGVPNKEIAARLFLSIRTVENKLHSAYEKLGVDGRVQLAEALRTDREGDGTHGAW